MKTLSRVNKVSLFYVFLDQQEMILNTRENSLEMIELSSIDKVYFFTSILPSAFRTSATGQDSIN